MTKLLMAYFQCLKESELIPFICKEEKRENMYLNLVKFIKEENMWKKNLYFLFC